MKNSGIEWIEGLPETWQEIPNRYLFIDHSVKVGESWKDYQLLSLTTSGVKEKDVNAGGGKVPDSYENYQTVEMGDMIFCLFDLDCSAVFSGLSNYNGMITSAYDVFMPNSKYLNNLYVDYWFQYVFSNRYYKMYSKNIRYTVTTETFKSILTPIPPLDEQRKIGEFLLEKDKQIAELIANQEKQIEKLKEYKQSVITEAVTKGLDKSAPLKDSGIEWIGEIPESWEVCPLKALFSFGKGLPITKENLVETGAPVISYGQIHAKWNSGVTTHKELYRFVNRDYLDTNPNSLVKRGDFIMADTSEDREGCGNCAYVDTDEEVFAGYHTIILKALGGGNNKYLAYLFLTDCWRSQIRKNVSGVKLFSTSKRILSSCTVLMPDYANKIVAFLDEKCGKIDRLIAIKQEKIEKLQEYKKSLIYEYVTGKKEVC